MGIPTFRRKLVELLQKHAHKWVKDVPEELLTFSLLERSVSFQHLDLQERFLENFGIKLPLVVHKARLDNVVVTAVSSNVVRLEVQRIILHGEVLPQEKWMDELKAARELEESYKAERLQKHEEAATGSTNQQAAAGGLLRMAPVLEIEVHGAELVIQDRLTRPESPFALAATSSRVHLGTPFSLQTAAQPTDRYVTHLDLRLQQYKMFCSNIPGIPLDPATALHHFIAPRNCVLGPCDEMQLDLRISSAAEMHDKEHLPRPSPAPSGLGHEVRGEEMLPMVSLAIRTTHSSLSFTQRQLADLIKHGRMWGTWFMCAQTFLDRCPPEEVCKIYREDWLAHCANLTAAESYQGVDQHLIAFEEEWPYREVLRQRTLAIAEMQFAESDVSDLEPVGRQCGKIECRSCEQSRENVPRKCKGQQGVWPRDPSHATTFLLDVEVTNTVVELRSESVLGSDDNPINCGSMTLRFVPLDELTQTVRYLLHVDNRYDTQPISNEVFVSNCRAEFVDRKGNTPLLEVETFYKFWDIIEHSDSLLCLEQPRRRLHMHLGNVRVNLMVPSFLRAVTLLSGSIDLAEIEDEYWDVFSALDLKSHCVQVSRIYTNMPSPQSCQNVSDIRVTSTNAVSLLIWPEAPPQYNGTEAALWQNVQLRTMSCESIDSAFQQERRKAAVQGMVVLQMTLGCRPCKDRSGPFELGRDVAKGEALGEVLSVAVSRLMLWRPAELPAEPLPAAGSAFWNTAAEALPPINRGPNSSHSVMLHAEEIRCEINMLSTVVHAKPVAVRLSVNDIALLISIAEWWRLQLSRLAKGDFDTTGTMFVSQASLVSTTSQPDSVTSVTFDDTIVEEEYQVVDAAQEDMEVIEHLSSSAQEDKGTTSTAEFARKLPKSLSLDGLVNDPGVFEEECIENVGFMQEVLFHVRVNVEKFSLSLCESSTGLCPLELQLDRHRLDVRLPWGSQAVEELTYSLHHVSIVDAKRKQYLLYCGGRPPASNMRWRDSPGRQSVAQLPSRHHRHDAVDFHARAIGAASCDPAPPSASTESGLDGTPKMEAHLHIQPLWITAQWDSIVDTCTCLAHGIEELLALGDIFDGRKLSETDAFDSKSDADLDPPSHPLNAFVAALGSFRFQLTLQQIVILVPCDEANALQICGRLNLTARGKKLKMMASGLYMAITSPPQNSEFGSEVHFREHAILHPARLRLYVDCKEEELSMLSFDAVLKAEPLRLSICTKHAVVSNALVQIVTDLLSDLAAIFLPIKETWVDDSVPLEEPPARHSPAWRARLQVHLEAVSIGLVDSQLDVEICEMLVEDSSIMLQTCFGDGEDYDYVFPDPISTDTAMTIPIHESETRLDMYDEEYSHSVPTTKSIAMKSPARSATSVGSHFDWPVTVDANIRAISINMCQGRASRPFPLLEPVRLNIAELGAGKSNCSISWINANLSSTVVDVLTRFYLQVSKDPKSQSAASSHQLELENMGPSSTCLSFARISSSRSGLEGWMTLSVAGSPVVLSPPLGLDWPAFRVHNHLGQAIELRSGGYEDVGQRLQDIMLRMRQPTGEFAEACLRPSPSVQVLQVGRGRQSTRELVGNVFAKPAMTLKRAATRSFSGVTRADISSHVLTRREPAPSGNLQDIHLSSVVFIENRCNMDFIFVPVCPCCVSQSDQLAEHHRDPIVLTACSKPHAVPLGWFMLCACGQSQPEIHCGLAAQYLDAPSMETRRKLVQQGRLQPVINSASWKGILRYRSQVAGDYYLTASSLRLPHGDDADAKTTHLCANIYGISQDLDAMHSALFFTVALEPLVQFCNRLCCPLTLHGIGSTLEPGEDASILHDMGVDLQAEIETTTRQSTTRTLVHEGILKLNKICRHGKDYISFRAHRPSRDTSPKQDPVSQFRRQQSLFQGNGAQVLEAVICKELGLEKHSSWSQFKAFAYKPQSYRLIIFTRYWVVNRRSDCNIFIPHGYSANYARDRNTELLQVPCCSRRMLPEQALFRGRIRLGLYDHWNDSHGHQYVPVTGCLNVSQPTQGSVRMPRTKRNPRSISFGYTVQAAQGPFYRTLVIELVRRYTLVNNKNTAIFIHEKGDTNLTHLHMIEAGQVCQTFDPQWSSLQLAIAGWTTSGKDVRMKPPSELQFSAYFSIDLEDKQDRFHLHHQHHEHCEDEEMMMYKSDEVLPVSNRYTITVVDIKIEQGAVIISFSEAVRPIFRIVNQTGHVLQLKQDCAQAPVVHLMSTEQAEDALDFAWFNPWRDRHLEIWKEYNYRTVIPGNHQTAEKFKFDIEQVQKHPHLLKISKTFAAAQCNFWEEFTVHTKVNNGCREVHIKPWCRVVNRKEGTSIFVQSSNDVKGETVVKEKLIELVEGEEVCLKPMRHPIPGSRSETLALHIASARNIDGSVILLKARHAGQKRYVHHRKRNATPAGDGNGKNENIVYEVTEVVVQRDSISDFLVVELRDCNDAPYVVENKSRGSITMTMAINDDAMTPTQTLSPFSAEMLLPPGKLGKFIPHCWNAGSSSCKVEITSSVSSSTTIVDLERPGEIDDGSLKVRTSCGRPRRVVVKDSRQVTAKKHTHGKMHAIRSTSGKAVLQLFRKTIMHHHHSPIRKKEMFVRNMKRAAEGSMQVTRNTFHSHSPHITLGKLSKMKATKSIHKIGRLLRTSTWGLTSKPSDDGTYSNTDSLVTDATKQTSSRLIECLTPSRKTHSHTKKELVEEPDGVYVRFEGVGIVLLNSMAMKEVAYICVDGVTAISSKEDPCTKLEVSIDAVQVDFRDRRGIGRVVFLPWRPGGVWKTKRRKKKSHQLIHLEARWRFDGDPKTNVGHVDLQDLKLDVLPVEVRMDTEHLFVVAEWAVQIWRSLLPLHDISRQNTLQEQELQSLPLAMERAAAYKEGDENDPVVGEPRWKERAKKEDFKTPTPIFVKSLEIKKIEVVVSWRFSGRQRTRQDAHSELTRWHYILKKALPFDLSQASIYVGRHRFGLGKRRVADITRKDLFQRNGVPELMTGVLEQYQTAIFYQAHRIMFSQNLFLNVPRFLADVQRSSKLAAGACVNVKPKLFFAAVFLMLAACLQSVEDFFTTLAKTLCHYSLYRTPNTLRREPTGLAGIVYDAVYYSIGWHLLQIMNEWWRLIRHARSARSLLIWVRLPVLMLLRFFLAMVCAVVLIVAKILQFLHLLFRLVASRLSDDKSVLLTPSLGRSGPQQFYMGAPMQFSRDTAAAFNAAGFHGFQGRRFKSRPDPSMRIDAHDYWHMMRLPGDAGLLLAVRGRGFFLVCDVSYEPSVRMRKRRMRSLQDIVDKGALEVLWQASGDAWKPPELLVPENNPDELPLIGLTPRMKAHAHHESQRKAGPPPLLKLGSWPAVMTAYGFIRDFLATEAG